MIYFRSDYSTGAHPEILKAIKDSNYENHDGYGMDSHSRKATDMIKELAGAKDSEVYFLTGGTITNLTAVTAFLRAHEAVIAPSTAHIFVHETGAIEATGHKIFTFDTGDGKLNPDHIDRAIMIHEDEHMVKPKLVYISNATEIGSIYSLGELKKLRAKCDQYSMYLYMDGARIGSALTCDANDISLNDLAELTDAFYIGGTKNGFLFGEALLINNLDLIDDFRYIMKQKGGMLAKGHLLGVQFEAAFRDGLFFKMAEHANNMAKKLRTALKEKGYEFEIDSPSNQLFPIFSHEKIEELEKEFFFYKWHSIDSSKMSIRLVTEWTTTEDDINAFIDAL